MPYSTNYYEELFTNSLKDNVQQQIQLLKDKDIKKYRTKTIRSGNMLECEIYPIWRTNKGCIRGAKANPCRESQRNLNNENTKKNVIRLVNANFTNKDIWATFTYDDKHLPSDMKQAQKDIQNYIRRLNAYVKKNGLPCLKYIYVTEYKENDVKKRVHHHIIMNFNDRDVAEKMWTKGGRTDSERLQPDDYGLEGLARYITKDTKNTATTNNSKRYSTSKNLVRPVITIADSKITKTRAMKIAKNENLSKEIFEKIYKDYIYNDVKIKYSQFVSGAYIYVRMRKKKE